MPHPSASLIEIANLSRSRIESLFHSAVEFKKTPGAATFAAKVLALLFFEPSTRTRFSFEAAAARLGVHSLLLDGVQGSSLEKGESVEDTVLNVAAMQPAAMVIRCGDGVDMNHLQEQIAMPIFNAGWGMKGHPSQALLDALTLKANGQDLENTKLLVVGDVKHSRVMSSHFDLARILGYEIAVCGPEEFLPYGFKGRHFENLEGGMGWATSIMALRLQHERHGQKYAHQSYSSEFGINLAKLNSWNSDGILMHPGPVNYGVELDQNVNQDPRCKILEQVMWGTYLRQALLANVFSEGNAQ